MPSPKHISASTAKPGSRFAAVRRRDRSRRPLPASALPGALPDNRGRRARASGSADDERWTHGGDRTRVSVSVEPGARATITTQAAEKIYRALPDTGDAAVQVEMQVGDGAWAEWLAQETIVFEGSRLRRHFSADVAATGRLLAVESVVFGRAAMGEYFNSGMLHEAWRISRAGRLIWADALHLDAGPHGDGNIGRLRAMPFGFGTSVACSTIAYVGADASQQLVEARRLLSDCALPCGATSLDGIMLVRIMADDASELRAAVMKLIAGIRRSAASLPAQLPRVWHC